MNELEKKKKLTEWRKKNPDKVKLQNQRAYQNDKENIREMALKRFYKNHQRNLERNRQWKKDNPERCKILENRWRQLNSEKWKACKDRMRGKRRSQQKDTNITTQYLLTLKQKIGDICPYCGQYTENWHLDHIIPLSKEGEHMQGNVIYCCAECNLSKGNKNLKEWQISFHS